MKNLKFYTLICLVSFFGQTGAALAGDKDTDIPDLCVNDIVYSEDGNWKGTVMAIYPGGYVGVHYDNVPDTNGWFKQRAYVLGRTKGKIHGISVDEEFDMADGRHGKVKAIYLDGHFCTHMDGDDDGTNGTAHEYDFYKHWNGRDGHSHDKDRDKAKSKEACKMIGGFKIDDGVYNSTGLHGKVIALNCDTGKITVKYDDGSSSDEYPNSVGHDKGCVKVDDACMRKMSFINEALEPANHLYNARFNQSAIKAQQPDPIQNYEAPSVQTNGLLAI